MSEQSQQPRAAGTRGGMPMGSTVAIIVAAVAVVLGLLVLKKLTDDDDAAVTPVTLPPSGTVVDTPVTSPPLGSSPVAQPGGTTPAATGGVTPAKTGSKIQVANSSRIAGASRKLSSILDSNGYDTATPVNGDEKITDTVIYYTKGDAKAEAVALSLADTLKADPPEEMPTDLKIDADKLDAGVGVLIMLGTDKADKTLSAIQGGETASTEGGSSDGTTAGTS